MIKFKIFLCIFVTLTSYSYFRLFSFRKRIDMKYILLWTRSDTEPFINMGKGQDTFIKRNCPENKCFVITDRTILDITDFDAILFHGPELHRTHRRLPTIRSLHQKYVFVSMESPVYYPLHSPRYDYVFNWTWTYKLSSDEYFGYIIIRNEQDAIVGPKVVMHWPKIEKMKPIDHELLEKLKYKKLAAASFVSNCKAPSGRDIVAKRLGEEMAKYNMTLDIYGRCGTKKCPKDNMANCLQKVQRDYYFYLSFENSFSEDYVTEKLLNALQHYAVPIVYGGANYSRFLPDGAYLDVRAIGIKKLVKEMVKLINNKEMYYNYFRWRNHYTYHNVEDSPQTDYYCQFCRKLNDAQLVKSISIHKHFTRWWHH